MRRRLSAKSPVELIIWCTSMLAVYVTVLSFGFGWVHEYRSCLRHNAIVPATHQYPLDAATAREKSAAHELERGRYYDPVQAKINGAAVVAFRADAAGQRTVRCLALLPPVK